MADDYASGTIYTYSEIIEVCYVRSTMGLACHNCKFKGKRCDSFKDKKGMIPAELKKKEIKSYGNTEHEEA